MDYLLPAAEILLIYLGLLVIYGVVRGSTGDSALKGIAIVIATVFVGSYIIATYLHLYRIELLIGKVIDYLLIAVLVIFHPELRRGVMRLGQHRFFNRFTNKGHEDIVATLAVAAFRLSRSRTGALVVVERTGELGNYADRGIPVDAALTAELLDTVFFPGGPMHDGAVIVREGRVLAAGCLLPLTENVAVSRRLGTRHRAAIGITEESDAISIVVSEETGSVGIAFKGQLVHDLTREDFERKLRDLLADKPAPAKPKEAVA